jgi:hypothetical protein
LKEFISVHFLSLTSAAAVAFPSNRLLCEIFHCRKFQLDDEEASERENRSIIKN